MIIINFVVFLIFDPTREFHRNMPWGKAQNVAATASASGAKTLPPKAAGRKDCSSSPIGGWTKTQNVSESKEFPSFVLRMKDMKDCF